MDSQIDENRRQTLRLRRIQREADEHYCLTDLTLRREYGGRVVAIHAGRVWGVGDDASTALAAAIATTNCPAVADLLIAVAPSDLPSRWDLPYRPLAGPPLLPREE
jgi:hypothetical protein